jgi:hypothetical protein
MRNLNDKAQPRWTLHLLHCLVKHVLQHEISRSLVPTLLHEQSPTYRKMLKKRKHLPEPDKNGPNSKKLRLCQSRSPDVADQSEFSSPPKDPYADAPLDLNCKSFRLVEILPSGPSETIRCRLETFTMPPNCPSYIALSYMWGSNERYADIELNGVLFPVGLTLWTFLNRMRLNASYQKFWIDAICINQKDVNERNHQVKMMQHIYSSAESVSIWLGESRADKLLDKAMAIISKLEKNPKRKHWTPRQIEAVTAFCNHAYWNRVWIIQEVALARRVTVHCGPVSVGFAVLPELMWALSGRKDWEGISSTPAFRVITFKKMPGKRHYTFFDGLQLSLMIFSKHQATDIRDKIYAIQGLSTQPISDIPIDYHISPSELWDVVMLHLCRGCARNTSLHNLKNDLRLLTELLQLDVSSETMSKCIETHFLPREPPIFLRKRMHLWNAPNQFVFTETTISTFNPCGRFSLAKYGLITPHNSVLVVSDVYSELGRFASSYSSGYAIDPETLWWVSEGWTNIRRTRGTLASTVPFSEFQIEHNATRVMGLEPPDASRLSPQSISPGHAISPLLRGLNCG